MGGSSGDRSGAPTSCDQRAKSWKSGESIPSRRWEVLIEAVSTSVSNALPRPRAVGVSTRTISTPDQRAELSSARRDTVNVPAAPTPHTTNFIDV